jgi:hypothetical protein
MHVYKIIRKQIFGEIVFFKNKSIYNFLRKINIRYRIAVSQNLNLKYKNFFAIKIPIYQAMTWYTCFQVKHF